MRTHSWPTHLRGRELGGKKKRVLNRLSRTISLARRVVTHWRERLIIYAISTLLHPLVPTGLPDGREKQVECAQSALQRSENTGRELLKFSWSPEAREFSTFFFPLSCVPRSWVFIDVENSWRNFGRFLGQVSGGGERTQRTSERHPRWGFFFSTRRIYGLFYFWFNYVVHDRWSVALWWI